MTLDTKSCMRGIRIAILLADGVDADALYAVRRVLEDKGASINLIAPSMMDVQTTGNRHAKVQHELGNINPELFDAIFIPGGRSVELLSLNKHALAFVASAYKRSKVIATAGNGMQLIELALHTADANTAPCDLQGRVIHYISGDGSHFFKQLVDAIVK